MSEAGSIPMSVKAQGAKSAVTRRGRWLWDNSSALLMERTAHGDGPPSPAWLSSPAPGWRPTAYPPLVPAKTKASKAHATL
jgi:hypothetical protein